jgi:hypothetical protein
LDFALTYGIAHGGWCPRQRWAEDGPIPERYQLRETPSSDPAQRTEWNVRDSDGTVIFSIKTALQGGSRKTAEFAAVLGKPLLHLARNFNTNAPQLLRAFLAHYRVRVLNVAGPRESEQPGSGAFADQVLTAVFGPSDVADARRL